MPHAHILIILENKILTPRHIDEIVWAEIPCPVKYPELYAIVGRCMIHDPCDEKEDAACRQEQGQCKRRFPKQFGTVTTTIGNGYPQYRRRGRYVLIRNGQVITDQWVVPYNPMLLLMFDCHINIEIAYHKRCFKYVYKYCFKSPDHATVVVDEIEAYLSGRLLTSSEAVWRLLGLKMHKEYPPVMRLDVHLPEHQNVVFDPTSDVRDIFEAAERASSTLLEWFELNKRDPEARLLLYTDVPEHYVWKEGIWMPRTTKGKLAIGRMYGVSLYNYELFALRTLLQCVRGCTGFVDLLTVDGFIHPTFREACSAFGFIHDDSEFIACYQEFLDTQIVSIHGVRYQFAFMLLNIKTVSAVALFEHFAADLCGDEVTASTRLDALFEIEQVMQNNGKSLSDSDYGFDVAALPIIHRQENQEALMINFPELSPEQQTAMDIVTQKAASAEMNSKVLAIVAAAGTGKTFFLNVAVRQLRIAGYRSMCIAASALAASLIPNGKTAHAALKIPIEIHDYSYCSWDFNDQNELRNVDVIFWDEISMVDIQVIECIDRSLRRLMDNDIKFGGKVIVLLGDFRQLTPIVKGGRGDLHSIMLSDWFDQCPIIEFTYNFRSGDDVSYRQFLSDVGNGKIEQVDIPIDSTVDNVDKLIDAVYGIDVISETNHRNMILAYTLDQCALINDRVFERIPGEVGYSVASDDLSECRQPDEYPLEYIQSVHIPRSPPASLMLKINARYMIIRNCNPPAICNGILAELMSFTRYILKMKLLTGPGKHQIIYLPRCSFKINTEDSGFPFAFTRRQFPIMPAYAVTVHKSQGQTLCKVGIVADTDAFAHGQVYVALSRVRGWSNITFFSPRGEKFMKNNISKPLMTAILRYEQNK